MFKETDFTKYEATTNLPVQELQAVTLVVCAHPIAEIELLHGGDVSGSCQQQMDPVV